MTSTSREESPRAEFVCPFCGYDEIAELAISVVLHNVRRWDASGNPAEYERTEVDWETDFPYAMLNDPDDASTVTLECRRCCEHFEKPKRQLGPSHKANTRAVANAIDFVRNKTAGARCERRPP